jgi:glutamine phosphoribosylpyrophosphate amidotransferase
MCGIVAYLDKSGSSDAPVGAKVLGMLGALACRGPDSSGVALWGPPADGLIVRVKVGEQADPARAREVLGVAARQGRLRARATGTAIVRFTVAGSDPGGLAAAIEAVGPDIEVVSMGRQLQLVKRVGAPEALEAEFRVSRMTGTHGIGHTRLSTESRVDLSHSQPFWAHGTPDLAVVHNGHITNYHRLRRLYEQEGVRFYTENDSEVIGIYLGRQLVRGASFREALEASVRELDGSFSYFAAVPGALGYAKDPYCLKPLLVSETDEAVALANEEIAIHAALAGKYRAREAGAATVGVWEIPRGVPARRAKRRVA